MIGQMMAFIAAHIIVLGFLFVLWKWIRSREPMTAAHLRRVVQWERVQSSNTLPCAGNLSAMAAILRALDHGGSPRDLLRVFFMQWERKEWIALRSAPKRALHAFGADIQLEIIFQAETVEIEGTQQAIYQLIRGWMDSSGALQQSALYQSARKDARTLDTLLRQLTYEEQRILREMGASIPERKKARLGLTEQKRELYTPKGIRFAREAAAFAKFAAQNQPLQAESAEWAAMAGIVDAQLPACVMADAVWNGMVAGKQVLIDSASQSMLE